MPSTTKRPLLEVSTRRRADQITGPVDKSGLSMIVFETQDAAESAKQMIESIGPPDDAIALEGVEVREVVANA